MAEAQWLATSLQRLAKRRLRAAMAALARAAAQQGKEPREVAEALRKDYFGGKLCVGILGGEEFQSASSVFLVQAIARELHRLLGARACFLATGMRGVQETFVKHCGDSSRVWNLVPAGRPSPYGIGSDLHVGTTPSRCRAVLLEVGDVYITVEGGSDVVEAARAVLARGGSVVPVMRTGGASSGLAGFPAEALLRPPGVKQEQWLLLGRRSASIAESAAAVAAVVARREALRGWDPRRELGKLKALMGRRLRVGILGDGGGEIVSCTAMPMVSMDEVDQSLDLVKAVAEELHVALGDRACFITAGRAGVHEVFAKRCGDGSRVFHLLPAGETSSCALGRDIHCETSNSEQCRAVFCHLAQVYISFGGGPSVAEEARDAASAGASIVPLIRSGGASAGLFGFPPQSLRRPPFVTRTDWGLLQNAAAPAAETARAVAAVLRSLMAWHELPEGPLPTALRDTPPWGLRDRVAAVASALSLAHRSWALAARHHAFQALSCQSLAHVAPPRRRRSTSASPPGHQVQSARRLRDRLQHMLHSCRPAHMLLAVFSSALLRRLSFAFAALKLHGIRWGLKARSPASLSTTPPSKRTTDEPVITLGQLAHVVAGVQILSTVRWRHSNEAWRQWSAGIERLRLAASVVEAMGLADVASSALVALHAVATPGCTECDETDCQCLYVARDAAQAQAAPFAELAAAGAAAAAAVAAAAVGGGGCFAELAAASAAVVAGRATLAEGQSSALESPRLSDVGSAVSMDQLTQEVVVHRGRAPATSRITSACQSVALSSLTTRFVHAAQKQQRSALRVWERHCRRTSRSPVRPAALTAQRAALPAAAALASPMAAQAPVPVLHATAAAAAAAAALLDGAAALRDAHRPLAGMAERPPAAPAMAGLSSARSRTSTVSPRPGVRLGSDLAAHMYDEALGTPRRGLSPSPAPSQSLWAPPQGHRTAATQGTRRLPVTVERLPVAVEVETVSSAASSSAMPPRPRPSDYLAVAPTAGTSWWDVHGQPQPYQRQLGAGPRQLGPTVRHSQSWGQLPLVRNSLQSDSWAELLPPPPLS